MAVVSTAFPLPLLVVLLGPTASGKTALSLTLAERFGDACRGEIVSCDSVAVYRELEIGTAKPNAEERARVRHHCIDIASPATEYSAGDYQRDGRAALADITARGRLPIVTGGTGLYLRALLDGLFAGPQRSEPLRMRLRRSADRHASTSDAPAWLWRVLERLDREAAARIHANDTPKLIRAIEVSLEARKPITQVWQDGRSALTGYRVLRLGLAPPRRGLYERINQRAAAMFAQGLVEETERLIAKYGDQLRVFDALGYRQTRLLLKGELTRAEAIHAAQQGHRNYAKRQFTWFRREPEVRWLHGFGDDQLVQETAVAAVGHALQAG